MQHFAESVQSDRLFFRDVGLVLDLVEDTKEDFVDETSESRVESSRSHDRLDRIVRVGSKAFKEERASV